MSVHPTQICIIGAGPAGLAVARALQEKKIDYEHVDAGDKVGGIWDISRADTPMYQSAHFISSKTMSGFTGFPMPEHYADYPRHDKIQSYIEQFAGKFSLTEHIRFNTTVTDIELQDDGRWKVVFNGGEVKYYFGVVCATGSQWTSKLPRFSGEFSGEIIHSKDYLSSDIFNNKRVLVIGAGNSGCDIACDAAISADVAYISMRRGYNFIPKHIFGKPADVFNRQSAKLPLWARRYAMSLLLRVVNGDLTKYGLEAPDHKLFESHPILNSQLLHYLQHGGISVKPDVDRFENDHVVFKDGSKEKIDLIVSATGFSQHQPYGRNYFEYTGSRPKLFLQIFNRQYKNLFGISHIETNSGIFTLFGQMAYLLANYLRDQIDGSVRAKKMDDMIAHANPDLCGGISFHSSERHSGYVDSTAYKKYLDKLTKEIGWLSYEEHYLTGIA